jgi:hypothetical protein
VINNELGRLIVSALLAASTLGIAGCGERPQVIEYKQGIYQGKPDTPPYDSVQFNGSKAEWERAVKTRNQSQNEYKRTS